MNAQTFRLLYPFASHFVAHDSVRQHYVDEGRGPAVVMVHGNPTWSFFYRDLIKALREEHRCIAPDHVGCGFSDKPQSYAYTLQTHIDNLERLLAQALPADEPVDLVVHDWGGPIGLGWAVRHPERVRRIVILNTGGAPSDQIPLRINLCRVPLLGALAVRGLNGFAWGATRMTTVRPLPRAVREGFLLPYGTWHDRIATLRFVQDIPDRESTPSTAVLRAISQELPQFADRPAQIHWGARDWCFTMHFYEEWRRRWPHADCHVYNDAGHYLLEDAGERILPQVKAFLADH